MPKRVDHDARRAEIVAAFLRLVARDGLAGATSRSLTAELGVATGTLWRYFRDFDALIELAYEQAYQHTEARIEEAIAGRTGEAALLATMREILPLQPVSRQEAEIVVGFWGRLAQSPTLATTGRTAQVRWHERCVRHLREAVAEGELRRGTPIDVVADVLVAVGMGQQIASVIGTGTAAAERQTAMLHGVLDSWRPVAG